MSSARRRPFGPSRRPCPVELGKDYDVEITEVSRRGEGIARVRGFVIFVPNTRPGDKVKVRITRVGPRCANATVVAQEE